MVIDYKTYHNESLLAKDIDPSIICLKYIADRYELNIEQRYWIAFLYGTCYSAVTTFYIYNEFPDFECVDVNRLNKWWLRNKNNIIFQTDRLRIKSNDQFVDSFKSYKSLVKNNQQRYFQSSNWKEIYKKIESIKYFGRFSLFNYLDVLNQITDINLKPTYLNMIEAESCRNGLAYAINREDLVGKKITSKDALFLHNEFIKVLKENKGNIFQIETTLCAYKKYRYGKRYIGYYIERMRKEIIEMQGKIKEGVYWDVLWEFRNETFTKKYLNEFK